MDNVEFSSEDIKNLAERLSAIDPPLDGQESQLLVAIFAAAATLAVPAGPFRRAMLPEFAISTEPQSPDAGEDVSLADLKYQLLNAFIPGQDFTYVTTEMVAKKVVGKPIYPPPPLPPPPGDGE
jgi:hypothetical protein